MPKATFDKWLESSDRKTKPFADYAMVQKEQAKFDRDVKEVKPSEMTEAQKVAYDAVSTMLKKAGIPVKVVSNEDMEKVAEAQDNLNLAMLLNQPEMRFKIKTPEEKQAAENAYNFAKELRPDKWKQYAVVDMSNPTKMPEYFEEQLLLLNQELTEMGSLCEEIISLATQALGSYTKELGEKVSKVGAKIDEEERTIETICMRLLLRQQPVARDLRAVSAALKMITDMERIGDQAEDIVEIIPCMIAHPHEEYPKIREMAKETIAMVTDSVDAYVKQDVYLAKAVQMHDDVVDNYFTRIKSGLIDMIAKNPAEGEYALDLLMIAKYFERIGDHATNIAEWVEFSVTGSHNAISS